MIIDECKDFNDYLDNLKKEGDVVKKIKLKPCPWCGGIPEVIKECEYKRQYSYHVICTKCEMKPRTFLFNTERRAKEIWNNRKD
jgi:predicted RNA-binding Zn-ribbon protein involved in translation (DUF1610 family)